MLFCSWDLDLGPMTFIYKPELDIMKMYVHTKNEIPRPKLSKPEQDKQRDRHS